MAITPQSLFSWQGLDASSDIVRFRLLIEGLDDARLMRALRPRGRGRRADTAPEVMWNSLLAGLVFGHESNASLRRELRRNPELRQACGFDPLGGDAAVPDKHDYTRFHRYKLHMRCDARTELPIAFRVTRASENESPHLVPLVEETRRRHPRLAARARTLAADKGYDDGADKAALWDAHQIAPIIPPRRCGRGRMEPLDPRRSDTIYYSSTGEVACKIAPFEPDPAKVFAPMQFQGFEADRQTLKSRCCAATAAPPPPLASRARTKPPAARSSPTRDSAAWSRTSTSGACRSRATGDSSSPSTATPAASAARASSASSPAWTTSTASNATPCAACAPCNCAWPWPGAPCSPPPWAGSKWAGAKTCAAASRPPNASRFPRTLWPAAPSRHGPDGAPHQTAPHNASAPPPAPLPWALSPRVSLPAAPDLTPPRPKTRFPRQPRLWVHDMNVGTRAFLAGFSAIRFT